MLIESTSFHMSLLKKSNEYVKKLRLFWLVFADQHEKFSYLFQINFIDSSGVHFIIEPINYIVCVGACSGESLEWSNGRAKLRLDWILIYLYFCPRVHGKSFGVMLKTWSWFSIRILIERPLKTITNAIHITVEYWDSSNDVVSYSLNGDILSEYVYSVHATPQTF